MKKLLIALMFPAVALADSWSLPNKGGGEIVITDRDCIVKGTNYSPLKSAFSHTNEMYMDGCWYLEDGMVKIIWDMRGNPERRAYRIEDFNLKNRDSNNNRGSKS